MESMVVVAGELLADEEHPNMLDDATTPKTLGQAAELVEQVERLVVRPGSSRLFPQYSHGDHPIAWFPMDELAIYR
jgi:hypothetical protein